MSKEKEAETTKTAEAVVYVGPTIAGVASHNTIFNNDLPQGMIDAIAKEPGFNNLLVPVSGLATALDEINHRSGATYVFYQKAENYTA